MTSVREALVEQNPWWKGGEVELEYHDRAVWGEIRKYMDQRQIVALTGLRRVGKTTLLLKAAHEAIHGGLEPRRVVYFSFDEFHDADVRAVLREYEAIVGQQIGDGKHLILLDEIQKLKSWEESVKALYDRVGKSAKILVSGSESLFIRKGSRETLAGRMYEFRIEPLSFREFLTFRGVEFEPLDLYERELANLFEEFAVTQGFPELVDVGDRDIVKKYLQDSIVEKVVFRDLPGLLGVRDMAKLKAILNILMEEPGQIIEFKSLASELGLSRITVSKYLGYLEDAFLVRKLYNHSTGRRKVERKMKKYYPTIVSVNLLFKDDTLSRSKVFEWLVVNQLRAEYFWRDRYKNEVDVVLPGDKPVPVEIKYGKVALNGVAAFMRNFKVGEAIIVTRREEGERTVGDGECRLVPAYKFLLENPMTKAQRGSAKQEAP